MKEPSYNFLLLLVPQRCARNAQSLETWKQLNCPGHHLPGVLPTGAATPGFSPRWHSICMPVHLATSCQLLAPHLCLEGFPQVSAHLATIYSHLTDAEWPVPSTSFRPTCTVTSHSSFMLCLHCGGLVAADQLWSRQLVNFPGVYWVAIIPFPMGSKLHPRKGAPFGVCPSLSTFPLP